MELEKQLKINTITMGLKVKGLDHVDFDTIPEAERGRFANCVIIKGTDDVEGKRVATKIFRNGALHMTGATSMDMAFRVAKHCVMSLGLVSTVSRDDITINVQMINASFKVAGKNFMMKEMYESIAGCGDKRLVSVTFEKEDHPAINMKVVAGCQEQKKPSTILMFRTGSVILTGMACGEQMAKAFGLAIELLTRFRVFTFDVDVADVTCGVPKKRGRKRKAVTDAFYDDLDLV